MSKKAMNILGIVIGLTLILSCVLMLNSVDPKGLEWSSTWNHNISLQSGKSKVTEGNFTIDKSGDYTLHLTWKPEGADGGEMEIVTRCTLMEEQGRELYSSESVEGDIFPEVHLEAGNYHLNFKHTAPEAGLQQEITRNMAFGLHVHGEMPFNATVVCALFGLILGGVILVLALIAMVKQKGYMRQKYDERQELEQGRGFRYAFFAGLVSTGVALMVDLMGIVPARKVSVFYAVGIFIGISVYVVYCIWHDCYIALNEKRRGLMIFLVGIGVLNLFLGIMGVRADGYFDGNGRYSVCILNLMCAAMCLVAIVAMLLRIVTEARSTAEEDEE